MSHVDTDLMIRMYRSGAPMTMIARIVGVDRQTVRRRLVGAGVKIDSRRHAVNDDVCRRASQMIESGASVAEAADELAVGYNALYHGLRQRGHIRARHRTNDDGIDIRALIESLRQGGPPRSVAEIAAIAGVTRQRIYQILRGARP